ncbi:S8 family peptidase [Tenacibaculum maritimum]|uniref:S8 family peptidase n=1 Tax=Tenacibaculum maritimum TaxID=107401 RepID=UPI00040151EA|nr:S8 family peptidase [Tenacibaculum maritimum]
MKKKYAFRPFLLGILAVAMTGCQDESLNTNVVSEKSLIEVENITFKNSQVIEGRYVIRYKTSGKGARKQKLPKIKSLQEYKAQTDGLKKEASDNFQLKQEVIKATYGHAFQGFVADLTKKQLQQLRKDPRIASIEQDFTFKIAPFKGKPGGGGGNSPAQQIPYGTTRVSGGKSASQNTAWVLDTGVDLDHEDLNVDTSRSVSFIAKGREAKNADDGNGHGTHVAGTIAAKDNAVGSVGVAPGNLIVAIKVLDSRGSGTNSGVISGVDYVAANANNGDVANMSLGGGISSALDNAIVNAASKGIKFVLAAGNESQDANNVSPARVNGNNIYTISAMDRNDNWASYSNYGSPVDFCAPGSAIYSTWKDGGYNTISGTSMATPHAAGVLLFGTPSTSGTVNGDPDGNPDPIISL